MSKLIPGLTRRAGRFNKGNPMIGYTMNDFWKDADVIFTYTRAQAIEDGVLVDGTIGDLAEVTEQHYKWPVAMTASVFAMMEQAVNNRKHCNDYKGVWYDILWMSRMNITRRFSESCHLFKVIITGLGRKRIHELKLVCGPGDDAEPVVTIMLPDED